MTEITLCTLAATLPNLAVAYWVCLVLGGGLLLISSLSGTDSGVESDIDVDFDADLDFDADIDLDAESPTGLDAAAHGASLTSLATWFSVQFAVFFMAVFGVIGVTLTHLTDLSSGMILAGAAGGGFIVGQGMHQLMRALRRGSGNSATQARDYIYKLARVTVALRNGRKGQITLQVRRGDRFITAISQREDATFDVGDRVVVIAYRAGIAEVVSPPEFEALNVQKKGAPT